MALLAKNTV